MIPVRLREVIMIYNMSRDMMFNSFGIKSGWSHQPAQCQWLRRIANCCHCFGPAKFETSTVQPTL